MKKVFVVTALIGLLDKFPVVAYGVFNSKREAVDYIYGEYSLWSIATEYNKSVLRQQFDIYIGQPDEYDEWNPMFGGTGFRMHIKPEMI